MCSLCLIITVFYLALALLNCLLFFKPWVVSLSVSHGWRSRIQGPSVGPSPSVLIGRFRAWMMLASVNQTHSWSHPHMKWWPSLFCGSIISTMMKKSSGASGPCLKVRQMRQRKRGIRGQRGQPIRWIYNPALAHILLIGREPRRELISCCRSSQTVSAASSGCLRSVSWRGEEDGPRSISHDSPITSARSPRSTFVFFRTWNSWTFVAFFCLYPSFPRNMSCSFGMVGTKGQRGAASCTDARNPGHRIIFVVISNLLY